MILTFCNKNNWRWDYVKNFGHLFWSFAMHLSWSNINCYWLKIILKCDNIIKPLMKQQAVWEKNCQFFYFNSTCSTIITYL
jgi:hypothetical protein